MDCKVHEEIEFRCAIFEIFHRTAVRGGHEGPEAVGISAFQSFDGLEDAIIFSDHMARAAFDEIGEVGSFELGC